MQKATTAQNTPTPIPSLKNAQQPAIRALFQVKTASNAIFNASRETKNNFFGPVLRKSERGIFLTLKPGSSKALNFKTYYSYDLGHKDRAKPVEIDWICDVLNFAKKPYRKIHAVAVVGNVWSTTACHDLCGMAAPNASLNKTKELGIPKAIKAFPNLHFQSFKKGFAN